MLILRWLFVWMSLLIGVPVRYAGAKLVFKRLGRACKKLHRIWVDGTYRGHLLEWVILHGRFRLQPALHCDDQKGFVVLPRLWVVCLAHPMSAARPRL